MVNTKEGTPSISAIKHTLKDAGLRIRQGFAYEDRNGKFIAFIHTRSKQVIDIDKIVSEQSNIAEITEKQTASPLINVDIDGPEFASWREEVYP